MRNKVIILLIPLFFASGFGLYAQNIEINPPRPAKSDDYLKQSLKTVKKLIRVGNYDRALNLLMSMKKSFGNRKEIIDELKNVYRNKKDYSSLKNLILNELKTNPDSFMAICQLAEVYFLTDSLDTAKKYWEKAFELAGPSESRYIILAGYYRSYGFYDEAVSVYRRARAIFKKPQLFSRELSDIFLSRRDYKGAVAEYLRLLENGTEKKTKISKRIVSIASEADKPGEIEQVINSAIKNNPDNPILYSILGDINILDNNLTAAFENYKRADKLSPLKGDFIYGFTGLCYDNGKYEMAIQAADYYLAHIQNEKGRSRVNLLKAKSLVGLGFYLQAVELLDNIEKTSSDAFCKVDAILTAGEIYAVNLKDFEAAKDKFARIAFGKRYNFFSMIAKMRLAEINIKTGDFSNAISLLDELENQEKDKDLAEKAVFLKAEIAFFTYDFKKAIKGYERLAKLYSSGYYVNDCLDRLRVLKAVENDTSAFLIADAIRSRYSGNINRAVAILEKAAGISYSGAYEYILFNLASFYKTANMWEKAIRACEKYNTVFPEGLYIDRSIYLMAEIYFQRLSQPEKADTLFKKLLSDYPTSPLIEKARLYLNKIKSS